MNFGGFAILDSSVPSSCGICILGFMNLALSVEMRVVR